MYDGELESEELETIPPSDWDRRDHGEHIPDIDQVIKSDKSRFAAFCKRHGYRIPSNLHLYEKDKRYKPKDEKYEEVQNRKTKAKRRS